MRNIRITESQDRALQQGESAIGLLFWIVCAVLLVVWLSHDGIPMSDTSITVHKWPVAAVGNKPIMSRCEAANICILGWYL